MFGLPAWEDVEWDPKRLLKCDFWDSPRTGSEPHLGFAKIGWVHSLKTDPSLRA